MEIQEDRALYWLSVGAQPSESVKRVLDALGTWGRFERLRQGESMENLVAEAQAAAEARAPVDPKTRRSPSSERQAAAQVAASTVETEA